MVWEGREGEVGREVESANGELPSEVEGPVLGGVGDGAVAEERSKGGEREEERETQGARTDEGRGRVG